MPANLNGDFSKYPHVIRDTFSYVVGETCELRQSWLVYHRFFMEDQRLTAVLIERLDGVLGIIQSMLEDSMFLSIARLTDKDNRSQANLSIWCLEKAIPFATAPEFSAKVNAALTTIKTSTENIRKHRHKRLAHFDLDVSLNTAQLPRVTYSEIRTVLEDIEKFLNLYFWEFEQTTMMFDMTSASDITNQTEISALKAHAYDILEQNGCIPKGEWRRQWRIRSGH